jgi:FKBP-type peptidyl-prolyl cis-trans isomerase SlyD
MNEAKLKVVDDLVVSLDYTLRLDDGEVIDTSSGEEPLEFLQGHSQIIPGLEQELYGMTMGDEKDVVVAPADAYGDHDPDAYQVVSRDLFPEEMDLELGMGLRMRDASGHTLNAYVDDIRPDGVLLDFNHPLAGETLYFHIKVADLRAASSEELAHGHVHDGSDEH